LQIREGVSYITVTEKRLQQRFFCDNCKREVFLQAKYCDNCGGEIEWPEKIQRILAAWNKQKKKDN
jgi:rRNA maturation endonuclease Nob1